MKEVDGGGVALHDKDWVCLARCTAQSMIVSCGGVFGIARRRARGRLPKGRPDSDGRWMTVRQVQGGGAGGFTAIQSFFSDRPRFALSACSDKIRGSTVPCATGSWRPALPPPANGPSLSHCAASFPPTLLSFCHSPRPGPPTFQRRRPSPPRRFVRARAESQDVQDVFPGIRETGSVEGAPPREGTLSWTRPRTLNLTISLSLLARKEAPPPYTAARAYTLGDAATHHPPTIPAGTSPWHLGLAITPFLGHGLVVCDLQSFLLHQGKHACVGRFVSGRAQVASAGTESIQPLAPRSSSVRARASNLLGVEPRASHIPTASRTLVAGQAGGSALF